VLGVLFGLATVALAEAARPRGGTAVLLDWDRVRRTALNALAGPVTTPAGLASAGSEYRSLAASLEAPLLGFVGPLPRGAVLPRFEALDRAGWLDLNLRILRQAVDPLLEAGRLPNSLLVQAGRAGVDRYVAHTLAFLGRRVLGQYDPQLLSLEPLGKEGLYLVEPNLVDWGRRADLPMEDLRRWLILHEMTHAWQFAAHPWLRPYLEESLRSVLDSVTRQTGPFARLAGWAGVLPAQLRVLRRTQAAMSVVEGFSNLVMNELGGRLLPGFERLELAYRLRSSGRGAIEVLVWKLTGLELKVQQYRQGEAFCRAIFDRHGMEALNRVWEGPSALPSLDELGDPDAWQRRVSGGEPSRAALLAPSPR
jgi:coenzyme F420 biosynthesis associated uncharacterized protein